MTRRPNGDGEIAKLGAGQELDLTTCLNGFTRGAAYAAGVEHQTGALSVGLSADIVVLDADPFEVAPPGLGSVGVERTYFRGRQVFERN